MFNLTSVIIVCSIHLIRQRLLRNSNQKNTYPSWDQCTSSIYCTSSFHQSQTLCSIEALIEDWKRLGPSWNISNKFCAMLCGSEYSYHFHCPTLSQHACLCEKQIRLPTLALKPRRDSQTRGISGPTKIGMFFKKNYLKLYHSSLDNPKTKWCMHRSLKISLIAHAKLVYKGLCWN